MSEPLGAPAAMRTHLVDEAATFARMEAADLLAAEQPTAPGALAELLAPVWTAEDQMRAKLLARSGGPGRMGVHALWGSSSASLCRVGETWHLPGFGALVDAQGRVFRSTVSGAHAADVLSVAPGFVEDGEGAWRFQPPADAPRLPPSSVFVAWGGGFNYGHFLLDCLAALQTLAASGVLARFPAIAPPLKPWSRDLLRLAFGDLPVREVSAPVVRLEQAAFSPSMDHFLHAPNAMILQVREQILSRAPPAYSAARRIYLSRRAPATSMRVMISEAALELALEARGFVVVRPETLAPVEQIVLMREAEVVVAASGAALANALFLPPGAKMFEIQPQNFPSAWAPALCEMVGCDWFLYHPSSPAPDRETPWLRRVRRGFRFGYRVEVANFLRFLEERL